MTERCDVLVNILTIFSLVVVIVDIICHLFVDILPVFYISVCVVGVLHEDLRVFLETNLPKQSKKSKYMLGVADGKIGAAIVEEMSFPCQQTGVVPEIIRGEISIDQ